MVLTLLFRDYCSLCHQMLAELKVLQADYDFQIDTLDVDASDALVEIYDEKVPVLLAGETELCHWHLDVPRVRAYLDEIL